MLLQVKNYHITKMLSQQMIVPSMSTRYNVTIIHKALEDAIGAVPSLSCEYDKVMLHYFLHSSVCTNDYPFINRRQGMCTCQKSGYAFNETWL